MPNYQTGVLYASAGDVRTQLMDIFKTYIEARGWTTNLYESYGYRELGDEYRGKRLHCQKVIGSYTRYVNLRSFQNQTVFTRNTQTQHTGIAAIASTGYDGATDAISLQAVSDEGGGIIGLSNFSNLAYAGVGDTVTVSGTTNYNGSYTVLTGSTKTKLLVTAVYVSSQTGTMTIPSRWDLMTGYTGLVTNDSSTSSAGCGAVDLPEDVLVYYLFSDTAGDNVYLICQNSTGYTGIMFGVTSTGNYFLAGSNTFNISVGSESRTNLLLSSESSSNGYVGTMVLRKSDNTAWWGWPRIADKHISIPDMRGINSAPPTANTGSIVRQLMYVTPDNFKGNNPLVPAYVGVHAGSTIFNGTQHAGRVPDVKYVNMKFMDSLTELTFGGDVYKLFRLYTADDASDATLGLAILK